MDNYQSIEEYLDQCFSQHLEKFIEEFSFLNLTKEVNIFYGFYKAESNNVAIKLYNERGLAGISINTTNSDATQFIHLEIFNRIFLLKSDDKDKTLRLNLEQQIDLLRKNWMMFDSLFNKKNFKKTYRKINKYLI